MKHLQKAPRKPLFKQNNEIDIFVSLFNINFDYETDIEIAKLCFIDGCTNEEVSDIVGYSKRQVERIRANLLKVALQRAIKKLVRLGVKSNEISFN